MRKRNLPRAPLPVIGPADDPHSLYHQMRQFLEWLRERNYSEMGIRNREANLRAFVAWCDERGVTRPQEVTRLVIERYQRYLFLYRKADGEPLTGRGQQIRLAPLRVWFRWMVRNHRILSNPAADMEMPRVEKRLPRHTLSAQEAEQILNVPDVTSALGIRDRAMLETLYSTGVRRAELVALEVDAIDYERGTLMVRQGKGMRDRMVPIGERALAWIRKYLDEVRPQLMLGDGNRALFLTRHGEALGVKEAGRMAGDYIRRSGLEKSGACHLFRHTMATLMLENGADVRFVQAMLGHADLKTTQIYTHVAIRALKEVHTATHPARLQRRDEVPDEVMAHRPLWRRPQASDAAADDDVQKNPDER